MTHVDLLLPGGTVMSAGLPLHPQLERQVRAGVLKLAEPEPTSPAVGLDGEGDAERVSASPPADEPPADEPPATPTAAAPPAGNASRDEWHDYAVSQGLDPDEAAGLRREELKARIVTDDPSGD